MSPSVLPRHSFFTFNLFAALYLVTRERGMGPIFSEVDVSPNPRNVVRPDLMWYGDLPTDDETLSQRLIGLMPWGVVETLSSRTQRYDQTEKRIKYQQMGVIEYWILDPKQKWIEVHVFPTAQGGKGRVTRLDQERPLRQRERDEATRQQLDAHAIALAREAQLLARLETLLAAVSLTLYSRVVRTP